MGDGRQDALEMVQAKEKEIEALKREQEQILKDEELKKTKAWQLSAYIEKLKLQRDDINQDIIQKSCELAKLCTHEKIRTEDRSYPGGYLDRAEYWTDYFCEVCGIKVDEKVEYGGFG